MFPNLILPYVVKFVENDKAFTEDMEFAAIVAAAESRRKKQGLLDVSVEKLSFVSKFYYPLWAIPWQDECVIVDGLGSLSYTVTYKKPPNVESFIEDINKNTTVRELYRNTLKNHAKTFEDFIEETCITIKGIISDKDILSTITNYLENSLQGSVTKLTSSALMPTLNKKSAGKAVEKFVQNCMQIESEIKGLQYAIKVLGEESKFHEEKILQETRQLQDTLEKELSRIQLEVGQQIERLILERDNKLERISKINESELKRKIREKQKIEKDLRKFELKRIEYKKRREIRKSRGDKVGVARWNWRLKECENKISGIKGRLQTVSRRVERIRRDREVSIKKLNATYQGLIDKENERVSEVKTTWEHEIRAKHDEQDELRKETSSIADLIKRLIEQKQKRASNLKAVTVSWKPERTTLICVPFYLAQYESKRKSRYDVYSPVVAMNQRGFLIKIQKALRTYNLESRMNLLLRPLSKALDKMLSSNFLSEVEKDEALSTKLQTIGYANNLLSMPEFRVKLRRGLEELQKEGWIRSKEKDTIFDTYA